MPGQEVKFKMVKGRPTFYVDPECRMPVRACGVLPFLRLADGRYYVLMAKYDDKWSDLGGKTDATDFNLEETAVRECSEETNCLFVADHVETREEVINLMPKSCEFWQNLIKNKKISPIYVSHSNYAVYPIQVKAKFFKKDFGPKELYLDYNREMLWIEGGRFLEILQSRNDCHPRLRHKKVISSMTRLLNPNKANHKNPKKND